ncbi:MAG: hypothetical protein U5K77_01590 [Candidatus Saccharibacteria bacterium]|nr:hypothetical protein [Candidatus Saccharibacteria bacterium]
MGSRTAPAVSQSKRFKTKGVRPIDRDALAKSIMNIREVCEVSIDGNHMVVVYDTTGWSRQTRKKRIPDLDSMVCKLIAHRSANPRPTKKRGNKFNNRPPAMLGKK